MRQPTNTPNDGRKFHRGKVKEVEMFQYLGKYQIVQNPKGILLLPPKLIFPIGNTLAITSWSFGGPNVGETYSFLVLHTFIDDSGTN
jgi:hypothetical protein